MTRRGRGGGRGTETRSAPLERFFATCSPLAGQRAAEEEDTERPVAPTDVSATGATGLGEVQAEEEMSSPEHVGRTIGRGSKTAAGAVRGAQKVTGNPQNRRSDYTTEQKPWKTPQKSPPKVPKNSKETGSMGNGSQALHEAGRERGVTAVLTTGEIAQILQSLPTRQELAEHVAQLKASMQVELNEARREIQELTIKMEKREEEFKNLIKKVKDMEEQQDLAKMRETTWLLKVDDLENRGRRNNIKIRGVPETPGESGVAQSVRKIINACLDRPLEQELKIERAHRVGRRGQLSNSLPRDILCNLHYYEEKEELIRKAWQKETIEFEGAKIIILPDLSKRTLLMRKALKPLLTEIIRCDATYSWGFPFHLVVKRRGQVYMLKFPSQLASFFEFLGIDPIEVPDWLAYDLVEKMERRGESGRGHRTTQ